MRSARVAKKIFVVCAVCARLVIPAYALGNGARAGGLRWLIATLRSLSYAQMVS